MINLTNLTGVSTEFADVPVPKGGLSINGKQRDFSLNADAVYFFNKTAIVKIPLAELWALAETAEPKLKLIPPTPPPA